MKIEIDLQDILGDEYGDVETLAESIKRQVADNITESLKKRIEALITGQINEAIQKETLEAAKKVSSQLSEELIDYEYTPVDSFGRPEEPTTMRKEFIQTLTGEMVYEPKRYASDQNTFTKSVEAIISGEMKKFEEVFNSKVDEVFTKEAFEYAVSKMKSKLKID